MPDITAPSTAVDGASAAALLNKLAAPATSNERSRLIGFGHVILRSDAIQTKDDAPVECALVNSP
jgi:hypothetical protein